MINNILIVLNYIVVMFFFTYFFTYFLQLSRYEIIPTLKCSGNKILRVLCSMIVIDLLGISLLFMPLDYGWIITGLSLLLRVIAFTYFVKKYIFKNKLIYTKRVCRQLFFIAIYFSFVMYFLMTLSYIKYAYAIVVFLVFLLGLYTSKVTEYFIARKYIYATKKKLKKYPNIKVIGITGSFGKTSTKEILKKMLQQKYICLATCNSYNTPMGVCKFILQSNFNQVEYLIIEMGAVRKNDVIKLCKIVNPTYGIITSIGEQHLDTFKTMENIISTKNELAEYVFNNDNNGIVIYNLDNVYCLNLYNKYILNKRGVAGFYNIHNDINYIYRDNNTNNIVNKYDIVNTSKNGTNFAVYDTHNKLIGYLSTMLLGKSFVQDIMLASTMALHLGVDFSQISNAVQSFPFVPNRMELRSSRGGASVIFDAYNSNQHSFTEMLDTIRGFEADYKLLITPGVVELGDNQYEVNKRLAKQSIEVFNEIWVINKVNKYAFIDVLNKQSKCKFKAFDRLEKNIFEYVDNLTKGNLVVFENDLPDLYV